MDRFALIDVALAALADAQTAADAPDRCRGEFPMTLWCPDPRTDYNYLSGYVLFHLAAILKSGAEALEPWQRGRIRDLLACGRDLPAVYQGPTGYNNWYRLTPSGARAPRDFAWPEGTVLSIRDDLDDTAISAMLCALADCQSRLPYTDEQLGRFVTRPNVALRASSHERLSLAGAKWGVYMSWVFEDVVEAEGAEPRVRVPFENSVELVTVSHVYTAIHRLGQTASSAHSQRASASFVNGLLRSAISRLLLGDTTALERAARYYPRVPYAPLSFVLRCHTLCDRSLLDESSLHAIAEALRLVGPTVATRSSPIAAPLYWLIAAGYSLDLGLLEPSELSESPAAVLDYLARYLVDAHLGVGDFVFFQDAHIGHYGGRPYANAVLLEACTLARSHGFV